MNLLSSYRKLISTPAQLAQCQQATSLKALLATLRQLWQLPSAGDDQLLGELGRLNQTVMDGDDMRLAGHWLPWRYHAPTRSIDWCLAAGHATEPFQDEYIARCRQSLLLNQIVSPRTSLASLASQARDVARITPRGFIFHLSRCGSTLISGCLSELASTSVFSESPVLTELLLDATLTPAERQGYLRMLIDLQASVFPTRPDVIIKWNAWDIFVWPWIRQLYPDVPAILLLREPLEILASHQRSSGRHMAGDPSLAGFHPVFSRHTLGNGLLAFRIEVLRALMDAMTQVSGECTVLDYRQLDLDCMQALCRSFGLQVSTAERDKMADRMRFHSKTPRQQFSADSEEKRSAFSAAENDFVRSALSDLYAGLLEKARGAR